MNPTPALLPTHPSVHASTRTPGPLAAARLSTHLALTLVLLAACADDPARTPAPATPRADAGPLGDAAAPALDAALADASLDAGLADAASSPDAGPPEQTYSLPPGSCFTFATATVEVSQGGQSCGDVLALAGVNVDLVADEDSLCLFPGTFRALSAVPTDDRGCVWSRYVEGLDRLIDRGMLVRDASGARYRVHLDDNNPTLVFAFDRLE